jgi:hypothetical protein
MELLIGCGSSRAKKLSTQGRSEWIGLVTLDYEKRHSPDVVHDLHDPLPFDDDTADEIHAYEVLEHVGRQGDYKFFFQQFADFCSGRSHYQLARGHGATHPIQGLSRKKHSFSCINLAMSR